MAPGLEWPRAAHRLVYTSSNRVRKKAEFLRHQNSPCSCCVPREIACVQFGCVCLVIAAGEGSPGLVRHRTPEPNALENWRNLEETAPASIQ